MQTTIPVEVSALVVPIVTMRSLKIILAVFAVCFVDQTLCKPSDYLTEGRGALDSVWSWLTSWWASSPQPINDELIRSTTYGPYDDIEVGKHNVTIWCNDQTCTTMRCDKFSCKNVTCNIYDTDMRGECREYNIMKPDTHIPSKPLEITQTTLQDKVTNPVTTTPQVTPAAPITTPQQNNNNQQSTEERPLELEAVLSSTVNEENAQRAIHTTKGDEERSYSYLLEIDNVLSKYVHAMLENYATSLLNKLIINLDIESFCVDGICYYKSSCDNETCEVHYCKYNLLFGEKKCTTNKSLGAFKLDLLTNKIVSLPEQNNNGPNTENNAIKIINKILN